MPTFLGRRDDKVIKEGPAFVLPGIEGLLKQDILPEESVITISDVRCQLEHQAKSRGKKVRMSGGAVSVGVAIIWAPDTTTFDANGRPRLRLFFDNGGRDEVKQMVEAMVEGAVRQNASTMTFEELTFSKARLSAELISIMTGVEVPTAGMDDEVASDERIKDHLKKALTNGVADIRDLGVKIRRLIVTIVEPEGVLKQAAEHAAAQLLERNAQNVTTVTTIGLADQIFKAAREAGSPVTYSDAMRFARVQEGQATEMNVWSGSDILGAAALLRQGATNPTPPAQDPPKGGKSS